MLMSQLEVILRPRDIKEENIEVAEFDKAFAMWRQDFNENSKGLVAGFREYKTSLLFTKYLLYSVVIAAWWKKLRSS